MRYIIIDCQLNDFGLQNVIWTDTDESGRSMLTTKLVVCPEDAFVSDSTRLRSFLRYLANRREDVYTLAVRNQIVQEVLVATMENLGQTVPPMQSLIECKFSDDLFARICEELDSYKDEQHGHFF